VKKDAIPGFINEFWAQIDVPGVYRGQCAELCGRDHGFMPVVVEAKTPEEYAAWLEAQRAEKPQQTTMNAESTLVAAR
jgi:cytochrome c oxidase subunit 2